MEIKDLEEKIFSSNLTIMSDINKFLEERSVMISDIPRLAFLSLYKEDTIFNSRALYNVYSNNLLHISDYYGDMYKKIYIHCLKNRVVLYNGESVDPIKFITTFMRDPSILNVEYRYEKYKKYSSAKLHKSAFKVTKTGRVKPIETARNYIMMILERNVKCSFTMTYQDFLDHIGSNTVLKRFGTKAMWDECVKENTILMATKLLRK